MPSRARIALLADAGTFRELDRELVSVDPLGFADHKTYRARLQEARRETGVREAVTAGFCRIGGHQAVLVVFDRRAPGSFSGFRFCVLGRDHGFRSRRKNCSCFRGSHPAANPARKCGG